MSTATTTPKGVIDRAFQDSSSYLPCASPTSLSGRTIHKYLLDDSIDNCVSKAVNTINTLLKSKHFYATFPTDPPEDFRAEVTKKKYLTINGSALCLAKKKMTPGNAPPDHKNRYFTETLLKTPVTCTKKHKLEKKQVEFWKRNTGGSLCPAGPDEHEIGSLEIDEELQSDIKRFKEFAKEELERERRMNLHINAQRAEDIALRGKVQQAEEAFKQLQGQPRHGADFIAGAAKVIFKIGGKEVAAIIDKNVTKVISKVIPVTSLVIGIILAIRRFYKQEYGKGVLEIASGAAALIPLVGTTVSVGLDVALAAHDMREATHRLQITTATATIDYKGACEILGIDTSEIDRLTQETVERHFEKQYRDLGDTYKREYKKPKNRHTIEQLLHLLNASRELIYKENGWPSSSTSSSSTSSSSTSSSSTSSSSIMQP